MKKTTSRLSKALIATAVVGALTIPAMASPIGDTGVVETTDTSLTIPKSIMVLNDGYTKTNIPAMDFSFSIAPAAVSADSTVTDSSGNTVLVQAGPAGGAALGSGGVVSIAAQTVTESDAGATSLEEAVTEDLTVNVDLTAFTQPGVYRYEITDITSASDLYDYSLVRAGDYDATRFLDVYVKRDATTGDLGVAGYVLTDDLPGAITDATFKSPGYVEDGDIIVTTEPGTDGIPGTADDVVTADTADIETMDRYISYNITLTKQVTGNMGDTDNQFPFDINIANVTGVAPFDENDAAIADPSAVSAALASGDSVAIYAIAPKGTVTVTETNNTDNAYTVTSSDGVVAGVVTASNDTATAGTNAVSNYATVNSASSVATTPTAGANNDLTFTNNLEIGTPTGFVMRVLPYIAVLGLAGAAVGVALSRKSRREDEA